MLGTVRRDALPPVDRSTRLKIWRSAPDEGIVEQTFFTVFEPKVRRDCPRSLRTGSESLG